MPRAPVLWVAVLFPAATAQETVCLSVEALFPSAPQELLPHDVVSLVHSSVIVSLRAGREGLGPHCHCDEAPYDPVCDENGVTYDSGCTAGCDQVKLACEGPCPCGDEASATGDPHVSNLAGEFFDINQPAEHVLLRLPLDPSRPPLLELLGEVRASEPDNICAMYIKMVTLRGEWLGKSTIQVRPLESHGPGSSAAGNTTTWPFSIRRSTASARGEWQSLTDFAAGSSGAEVLSPSVSLAARVKEDLGSGPESQAFEFMVAGQDGTQTASLIVVQGPHQALNLELKNMKVLGGHVGGLLGTEKHTHEVEEKTRECKALENSKKPDWLRDAGQDASRLAASW